MTMMRGARLGLLMVACKCMMFQALSVAGNSVAIFENAEVTPDSITVEVDPKELNELSTKYGAVEGYNDVLTGDGDGDFEEAVFGNCNFICCFTGWNCNGTPTGAVSLCCGLCCRVFLVDKNCKSYNGGPCIEPGSN